MTEVRNRRELDAALNAVENSAPESSERKLAVKQVKRARAAEVQADSELPDSPLSQPVPPTKSVAERNGVRHPKGQPVTPKGEKLSKAAKAKVPAPKSVTKAAKAPKPAVKSNGSNRCQCGCGGSTKANFAPGHDARLAGMLKRGEVLNPRPFQIDFAKSHRIQLRGRKA